MGSIIFRRNVIDVGYRHENIFDGIHQAINPHFRAKLQRVSNPYGVGLAAEKITKILKQTQLNDQLFQKHFYDLDDQLFNEVI